jgi:hypothetical protein
MLQIGEYVNNIEYSSQFFCKLTSIRTFPSRTFLSMQCYFTKNFKLPWIHLFHPNDHFSLICGILTCFKHKMPKENVQFAMVHKKQHMLVQ